MTYPNDPFSTDPRRDPKDYIDRYPVDNGRGGILALLGMAALAALILVAWVVGAFDNDAPTGAIPQQQTPPAQTEPVLRQ